MGQIRSHWLRRHLSFLIHSIRDEWEEAKMKILKTRLGRSIVKYKSVSGPKEFSSRTIFFKYWQLRWHSRQSRRLCTREQQVEASAMVIFNYLL